MSEFVEQCCIRSNHNVVIQKLEHFDTFLFVVISVRLQLVWTNVPDSGQQFEIDTCLQNSWSHLMISSFQLSMRTKQSVYSPVYFVIVSLTC
jgi:hypothetical protein